MLAVSTNRKGLSKPRRFVSRLVALGLLTVIYFFAGKFGLSLAFVNPSATAVWPPTGIALAAFLLLGDYAGIAILLGAFLVNYSTSGLILPSIAVALGNTLEGLLGSHLVRRFAHGIYAFNRTSDVFKFAFFAGLLSTAVGALIGVTSLVWSGLAPSTDYWRVWLTWWLGDAGGSLIVAPALILWVTNPIQIRWRVSRGMEVLLLLAALLLVALAVFAERSSLAVRNYPLEFALVPIIIWAAYRFGQRDTATVTLVLSAIAVWGTLQGFGPFARQSQPNESLLLLQSFMITIAITGLGLAALVAEHREVDAELQETNQKLKLSLGELEEHNHKMLMLNEMRDLLQSCSTFEEAYTIISQMGEHILPREIGVLYITNNAQIVVEAAAAWGMPLSELDTFALDDCWALRRGRTHSLNSKQNGVELLCPHLKHEPPVSALCIPMTVQGEAMGILHIRSAPAALAQAGQNQPALTESTQQIAFAMADSIGRTLANLKLQITLREQSIRDPLTSLFNRRYLEATLEREFNRAGRFQRSVGVVMLDLDYFKRFNDTFGHEAGDILLRELGSFLKQNLRGGDIACRYGGEEFALILPEVTLENVQLRAEQLREGIKHLNVQHNGKLLGPISLSVGIAMFPDHGAMSQEVLNAADAALYQAKGRGRDCVVIAPPRTVGESTDPNSSN
jgi:diguanylate cyclase (GGDEF)-like protein